MPDGGRQCRRGARRAVAGAERGGGGGSGLRAHAGAAAGGGCRGGAVGQGERHAGEERGTPAPSEPHRLFVIKRESRWRGG
eukprot:612288-Prymnesium_polylepis.2